MTVADEDTTRSERHRRQSTGSRITIYTKNKNLDDCNRLKSHNFHPDNGQTGYTALHILIGNPEADPIFLDAHTQT